MPGTDDLRQVLKLSIGLLCGTAFILILIILSGNEVDETSGKAIGTAMALAFFSLTAVAGSNLSLRRPQLSLFGVATVAISGLAFLVTTVAIWSGFESDNWKPAIYCLIVAFACGHSSVLLAGRGDGDSQGVELIRAGTILFLWLLVVLAIGEISSPGEDVDEQGFGVVAVIYALGTVVLPLLRRIAPASPSSPPVQVRARDRDELPLDHVCLVWPGSAESAIAGLAASGAQVVEGPVPRTGAQGAGL
ncbi:MAG TPA: hypothetical protein VNM41_07625, partial [Solirubrobacterales bacterium]|nr:hypothetical protein [Solirubrobacterales bacterium]